MAAMPRCVEARAGCLEKRRKGKVIFDSTQRLPDHRMSDQGRVHGGTSRPFQSHTV